MPYRLTTLLLAIWLGLLGFAPAALPQGEGALPLDLLRSEWERDRGNIMLALVLGKHLRAAGKGDEARAVVDRAIEAARERIEREGDSAELQYSLGLAALFLNRNYMALDRFRTAMALDPEREEVHLGLVRALLRLEREAEAMSALELAVTLFPESETVKSQLAEAHMKSGEYDRAIPLLEELRILRPEDQAVFSQLLRAYAASGDMEKAEPMMQELVEKGVLGEGEAALQMFRIHLGQGQLREARMALQRASQAEGEDLELDEAFRDYYAVQAEEAEKGENYRRAVLFWERALESEPEDQGTRYRLALAQAAAGNHEEALENYLPLMEQQPTDPRFYGKLSLTLVALERFEAASRVLELGYRLASEAGDRAALEELDGVRERMREAQAAGLREDR